MESTIHPHEVQIGDKLTILYKNEEIEVEVLSLPIFDKNPDEDKGWWDCSIRWKDGSDDWYAVWEDETGVWEVGPI